MATPSRWSTSMISRIAETIRGMRPSVGSSSRMILGSSIMARAMASICCSPPEAHDGLERRALAHAVAPEQSHDLAGAHLEGDAVQDMGLSVIRVDVFEGQDHVLR